jgi:hypothetical protein
MCICRRVWPGSELAKWLAMDCKVCQGRLGGLLRGTNMLPELSIAHGSEMVLEAVAVLILSKCRGRSRS